MRVFVTGATGFVGSALVQDLLSARHQVLGLARSAASAESLLAAGAGVHQGDLSDLGSLRRAAASADAVIHTAFDHNFSRFALNAEADRRAIEALGEELIGSERPLLVTSGLPFMPGRATTENDVAPSGPGTTPRVSEQTALALVERGVRASVVRMPQVHDRDKQGFASYLITLAREKGVSAYVGDGENRWPAVHRQDAAHLYRLVLERGAPCETYHAVTEEGVTVRAIAQAIGQGLGLPVVALQPDEAADHFGWLAPIARMDAPASSAATQRRLGWQPSGSPDFLADLEHSTAFGPAPVGGSA